MTVAHYHVLEARVRAALSEETRGHRRDLRRRRGARGACGRLRGACGWRRDFLCRGCGIYRCHCCGAATDGWLAKVCDFCWSRARDSIRVELLRVLLIRPCIHCDGQGETCRGVCRDCEAGSRLVEKLKEPYVCEIRM